MRPLALLLLAAAAAFAAQWVDRGEYDLALAIRSETVPARRLALLEQWKTRYAGSQYQQVRRELYLSTYQAMQDTPHMLEIAGEMLAAQPDQPAGAYWFTTLLPQAGTPSAAQLALGEKAARQLLTAQKTPAVEFLAHRALGWIQWQRKDYGQAEEEFRSALRLDGANGEITAWLGMVQASEQPAKQVPALWNLARSVGLQDPEGLDEAQKRQMSTAVERLYTQYHGGTDGLDQLLAAATASTEPPAGYTVESATAAAVRKEDEEIGRIDPGLVEWARMRRRMEGQDGEKYTSELHGTALPKIKGTLIRSQPAEKPNELTLGILSPTTAEVVLKLSAEFPNEAPAGTVLEFEGTIDSVARSPFLLTVATDASKISGWPAPPTRRK